MTSHTPIRRRGVLAAVLAIVTSAALALSGCAPSADGTAPSNVSETANTTLRWGWTLPSTWDSAAAVGYDVHVLSLVYSGLTKLSPAGDAEPDLAEKWEYNDDGTAVTFTLRENQHFSDGALLDAQAVKTSLERAATVEASTAAQSLALIDEITVDSQWEVTLHLVEVNYQIPLILAGLVGHLLSPAAIESGANIALEPVGAGPFVLDEYVPDSQATLSRNPDYWNADEIKIQNLIVLPKPDSSVAVSGVQSGQYTIAQIDNSQIDAAKAADLRVDVNDIYNVYTIAVNTRIAPFDNDLVTQALSHAIDRQALIDGLLFGYGTADWQPWQKDTVAFDDDLKDLYPHDVAAAKDLLEQAGYPDGVASTLHVTDDALSQKIAEVIQDQVAEAGIDLKIEIIPPGTSVVTASDGGYELMVRSFSGRESPVQGLEVLFGEDGWMNLGVQEPAELAPALDRARGLALDDPDYPAAIQEATRIAVTQNAPHVFLVNWVRAYAISPKVKGFDAYIHTQRFEGVEIVE